MWLDVVGCGWMWSDVVEDRQTHPNTSEHICLLPPPMATIHHPPPTPTHHHHGAVRDGTPSGFWPFINYQWANQHQIRGDNSR